MRLDGRCAVLTGAGTEVGRAVAAEAARLGMRLILVDRVAERLDVVRAHLPSGSDAEALVADIAHPIGRRAVHAAVARRFGHLHLLVSHADFVVAGPLRELDDEDIAAAIQINLTAPTMLVRELIDLMRAAAPARVAVVGSVLGEIGQPMLSAYTAAKCGLRGLTSALRRELAPFGVGVTYVAARPVSTDVGAVHQRHTMVSSSWTCDPVRLARRLMSAVVHDKDVAYERSGDRFLALVERLWPGLIDWSIVRRGEVGPERQDVSAR
ncbi:MAG: SDR family NAD(P)-dependent oxidoreductase [Alphaproteobacteria bacterium]|nr:SDR family NAD(P)-dependent oxidoreductase [Alphaproteobacteria bacterium]